MKYNYHINSISEDFMSEIKLRLPSTTSLDSTMWDYTFDPNAAQRQWILFQPTGGKPVKCTTRQENQTMAELNGAGDV